MCVLGPNVFFAVCCNFLFNLRLSIINRYMPNIYSDRIHVNIKYFPEDTFFLFKTYMLLQFVTMTHQCWGQTKSKFICGWWKCDFHSQHERLILTAPLDDKRWDVRDYYPLKMNYPEADSERRKNWYVGEVIGFLQRRGILSHSNA